MQRLLREQDLGRARVHLREPVRDCSYGVLTDARDLREEIICGVARVVHVAREDADVILGGWRLLLTGRAVRMIVGAMGPAVLHEENGTNTETWLAVRAAVHNIPVARFPMSGYVACDHPEWAGAPEEDSELLV